MSKVLVAMSGGLDSSISAVILKDQGYDIVGMTMKLFDNNKIDFEILKKTCCSLEDSLDAGAVANSCDFPHYVTNMEKEFKEFVIDKFVDEYKQGRTPNPCTLCNKYLKFDFLWNKAKHLGCKYIATGHYARIVEKNGIYYLAKGLDDKKDQSYFLFDIKKDILPYILFPVGELNKPEVRKIADNHGVDIASIANKKESQDICFIPDGDYRKFLKRFIVDNIKGDIVDIDGKVLGKHNGIHNYTIGQKKGLGLNYHEAKYVIKIDASSNKVVVGKKEDLSVGEFFAADINIFDNKYFDGKHEVQVKVRYNSKPCDAVVSIENSDRIKTTLKSPVQGVSPGQALVVYDGDLLVGGGWII